MLPTSYLHHHCISLLSSFPPTPPPCLACPLLPSFGEVSPPSLSETALPHLLAIHSALSHMGRPPPVVDATRLQSNPQGVLRALCQALDIPFYPEMLS
ncbi:unnamed protein product [Closterium sp. Naga37s-1]|nr:unnamed protein product [Closterium sp. Naga37s-1]